MSSHVLIGSDVKHQKKQKTVTIEEVKSARRIPELQAVIFRRLVRQVDGSYRNSYPTVSFKEMEGKPVREFRGGVLVEVLHAFSYSDGTMRCFGSFPPGKDLKVVSLPTLLGGECTFQDAQGNISRFKI